MTSELTDYLRGVKLQLEVIERSFSAPTPLYQNTTQMAQMIGVSRRELARYSVELPDFPKPCPVPRLTKSGKKKKRPLWPTREVLQYMEDLRQNQNIDPMELV